MRESERETTVNNNKMKSFAIRLFKRIAKRRVYYAILCINLGETINTKCSPHTNLILNLPTTLFAIDIKCTIT